ncbi:MAG TPA: MFS transporter, partial [Micromonosporaceae bacterium]
VERPVASAAYGFVRFIGGGLAPYVAGRLAEHFNIHVPFLLGGVAMLVAIAVLSTGHGLLRDAEAATRSGAAEPVEVEVEPVEVEPVAAKPLGAFVPVGEPDGTVGGHPIVVAVDGGAAASAAITRAAALAAERHTTVDLLHVLEVDIIGDDAVDRESLAEAQAFVSARLRRLQSLGVRATGHILRSVDDHANVGRLIADYAERVDAQLVIVGRPTAGAFGRLFDADPTLELGDAREMVIVEPASDGLSVGPT